MLARTRPAPCLTCHWRAGPVVDDLRDFGRLLAQSQAEHAGTYRPIQQALFDCSFDLTEEPSSLRAARALAESIGLPAPGLAAPPAKVAPKRVVHA